jgi:hypothetical protein
MSADVSQLREFLSQNCRLVSRFLGMGEAELRLLRESSQAVMARSETIVGEIVEELFRDPESARILQEAGLTREALQGMFRGWLSMAFEGDYGEGMCLEVSRIGLMFAAYGLDPGFVLARVSSVADVVLRHVPANLVSSVVLKVLRWNLVVAMVGYQVTRQWLFEKVLGIDKRIYKRLQDVALKEIMGELGVK